MTFYCYKCDGHGDGARPARTARRTQVEYLGHQACVEMFANGEPIPAEFSRAEVLQVLQAYYDGLG